jgi:hypothetical protein
MRRAPLGGSSPFPSQPRLYSCERERNGQVMAGRQMHAQSHPGARDQGMIRKSAKRFSEKIMPKQEAKAR